MSSSLQFCNKINDFPKFDRQKLGAVEVVPGIKYTLPQMALLTQPNLKVYINN